MTKKGRLLSVFRTEQNSFDDFNSANVRESTTAVMYLHAGVLTNHVHS